MKLTVKQVKGFIEVLGYALRKRDGFWQICRDGEQFGGNSNSMAEVLADAYVYLGGCTNWDDALTSELNCTQDDLDGYLIMAKVER